MFEGSVRAFVSILAVALSPCIAAGSLARRHRCDIHNKFGFEELVESKCSMMVFHVGHMKQHAGAHFTTKALGLLAAGSTPCSELQVLQLADSMVSSEACEIIRRLLSPEKCPVLHVLNLAHNQLGDDNIGLLAEGIRESHVESLDLQNNSITDTGAMSLASAFADAEELEEVFLDENSITRIGVTALSRVVRDHVLISFGGGVTPMTPGEAVHYYSIYNEALRRAQRQTIFLEGGGDRTLWPPCALLWQARLIGNPAIEQGRKECTELRRLMSSFGVQFSEPGSADSFVAFINQDQVSFARSRAALSLGSDQHLEQLGERRHQKRLEVAMASHPEPSLLLDNCFPYSFVPHDYVLHNMFFFPRPEDAKKGACSDGSAPALSAVIDGLNSRACQGSVVIANAPGSGFGSVVASWIKPLSYALEHRSMFWSPLLGAYRDGTGRGDGTRCRLSSVACFFKPFSKCERLLEQCPRLIKLAPRGLNVSTMQRVPECDYLGPVEILNAGNTEKLDSHSYFVQGSDEWGLPKGIPLEEFRHLGWFWWHSQLLAFLLREPNESFQAELRRIKDAVGWASLSRPLLSLHVRHGDSCLLQEQDRTHRVCEPLSKYMEDAVLPMAGRYGFRSIFLATDDEVVLNDTRAWPQFQWLYLPDLNRGDLKTALWEENLVKKRLDNYFEAKEVLLDVLLLAEGDAFVGKFTSNIDRIAFSLMTTRKQGLVPYASLDSPWCGDRGKPAGLSLKGAFQC